MRLAVGLSIFIPLVFFIILGYPILSSNAILATDNKSATSGANMSTAANATIAKQLNATIAKQLNATIAKQLNATIAETKNKTIATLNKSAAAQQVTITKQATQAAVQKATQAAVQEVKQGNITQQVKQLALNQTTQTIAHEFHDLPGSIATMLAITIILVIAVPVVVDLIWTHIRAYKRPGQGSSNDQKGIPGLYRALMAFGLIIVVGIIVVYLIALINFNIGLPNENVKALIDVLKNLGTILGTAVATVIAFYFGVRGATEGAKAGQAGRGSGGGGITPPAQVKGLVVSTSATNASTTLDLTWTANTESDLNHYNVYRGMTSGFTVTPGTNPNATPSTNSYTDTGIKPDTTYYYKVAAVDHDGNIGTLSAEVSGKTAKAP